MPNKNISVVIITKNRSSLLKKCIESLANENNSREHFEVIVVDNESTDNTKNTVENIQKRYKRVKYVHESVPGVSTAKNTGIKHAKNGYIAFIDDDSIADEEWLISIRKFAQAHPKIKIFGGPYIGYSASVIPGWFPRNMGSLFLGIEIKKISIGDEWLSATNLVVHKSVFDDIGVFDEGINMNDRVRVYGEETEFLLRADSIKYNIYYNPNQKVKHLIDPKKLNFIWQIKDSYRRGKSIKNLLQKYPLSFKKEKTLAYKEKSQESICQAIVKYTLIIPYLLGKIS